MAETATISSDDVVISGKWVCVGPTEPTPCTRGDRDLWNPEAPENTDDPEEIDRQRKQRRRALGACDTCYFRVNCAVNGLASNSTYGIWAGVVLGATEKRFEKAQRRLAEVIAAAILDSGEVPYRVDLMLRTRPELRLMIDEATDRVVAERQRPPRVRRPRQLPAGSEAPARRSA